MSGAYDGAAVTFATMHGKELLASTAFREILGATVTAPPDLDTDQFGTFAGDIPRTLAPLAAARVKARLGMRMTGAAFGLASEGSFGSGLGYLVENREILVFIDEGRGLEVVEAAMNTSPLPGARSIRSAPDALAFASSVGFPNQGVIVQSTLERQTTAHKTITRLADLESIVTKLLQDDASVTILPDYRAHKSPSRASIIRVLSERMARRLRTTCPACEAPGYGQVDIERGVPCSLCGGATQVIAADICGCALCEHRTRIARDLTLADPRWCDYCNP